MSKHSSRGAVWEETRKRVLNRDAWTCTACGKPLQDADATVDHVVPKSKGGTDADWNLRSLCRKCNSEKGDREQPRLSWYNPAWLDHL